MLFLSGCSSLPTIVPGLARRPASAVQPHGARGPLTAAQSKAVPDRLQSRGVQVNLIRDSVGTLDTPAVFFQELAATGIKVLEFNPINSLQSRKEWSLNQRDHRKLLIMDGHTAFLSGINISSVYSGGSFGSAPRGRAKSGPSKLDAVGPHVVRAIGSAPNEPFSLIYATLLLAINSAETSVRLTNAYFAPDPQLLTALVSAAHRGVDVLLILPSQTDS